MFCLRNKFRKEKDFSTIYTEITEGSLLTITNVIQKKRFISFENSAEKNRNSLCTKLFLQKVMFAKAFFSLEIQGHIGDCNSFCSSHLVKNHKVIVSGTEIFRFNSEFDRFKTFS